MMTQIVPQQSMSVSSLVLEMIDEFNRLEGNLEVIDVFFFQLIEEELTSGRSLKIDIVSDHLDLLRQELARHKELLNESLLLLRNET